MRFGETRDPAPTTMEDQTPRGLLAQAVADGCGGPSCSGEPGAVSGGVGSVGAVWNSQNTVIMSLEMTFGSWTGTYSRVWIVWSPRCSSKRKT